MANAATIDAQADRIVDAMTLAEQISLTRTRAGASLKDLGVPLPAFIPEAMRIDKPEGSIGTAGFVPAIPRVGFPAQHQADASLGIADIGYLRPGQQSTSLPSTLSLAATFSPEAALEAGDIIGAEAFAKGINIMLAGGVNLAREPRNGRNFEYLGEDPLLAGRLVGQQIAGIQAHHVASTIKHYAVNPQESGRFVYDARMSEAALRESDLLAFEIGVRDGRPASAMCAYNKVNGLYACENPWLMNEVLKTDWGFKGWVMSDWGAVHSLHASVNAGLDQQSPQDKDFFAGLEAAVGDGSIERQRVRDMARRIVRAMIEVGAVEKVAKPGGEIPVEAHSARAQALAEAGIVLLKNDGILPLAATARKIVVIGRHADKGVPIGGGSSQVIPWGGVYRDAPEGTHPLSALMAPSYSLASPLKALAAALPNAEIQFDDGSNPARAAALAASADVAIVYAVKTEMEGIDHADLSLPWGQDDMIAAVAGANPRTVVVLQTGNPVAMPWLGKVGGVLQAWFSGQRGGDAIASILTGRVAPSGRLPISFPASTEQLPHPKIVGFDPAKQKALSIGVRYDPFPIDYVEGSDVGYRWFHLKGEKPLFPFGFGLTYTSFDYSGLKQTGGQTLKVTATIRNTGKREGLEVAQLYVAPPGRSIRLAGWARVQLKPGESRTVTIEADTWVLLSYDESAGKWARPAGDYRFFIGKSAGEPELSGSVFLNAAAQDRRR
ncbi:glycoside hydrolase family 3 C-terminal domain-containing protein [Sandaracinobacter sp. RS1-74]|uniref:glycoside hydrolase family 3 C-terminal domain-containing protein n=1 Tax=Sandaracinobacteroides sayramensis TaxID=2913411 RepID=UPI001EDC6361|nr:glycoside hydrolase family 3 C-terminal domain-containing protein [Sandaracinobacteroides sayramensis]MCG2840122.1 glycoside hydrolase family 3 C-terminal domain-containing protein [Sandaracinobacteroides sayramensis]